ncbi:MAG TPA: transcription antitermination factor NusB, partial [Alphaproteobacteria bacterium]|nr:transcription antitermination factor NusB [Alphaproteobacteria bacterium]
MTDPAHAQAASLDSRKAALDALARVVDGGETLEAASDAALRTYRLEPRDRAFARLLLMTALRRHGELEALIGAALERPLPKDARAIRHILALGLVQLLMV